MSESNNKHYKIIVTGPVGAGKTTCIKTISDVAVVQTEARASDETKEKKVNTTVAMDFGVINLDDGNKIHIYGTPGQERFNFMWDILTKGSIGLIVLIDAQCESAIDDLEFFLSQFASMIENTAVAIGLNKTGDGAAISLAELRKHMQPEQLRYPLFEIDARDKTDVSMLIESLLYTLNPCLEKVANGN
jgi:signal recognition particle receptor subunit beta